MTVPALSIPIRANLDGFKKDMNETSSLVGTAVRGITKQVVSMNAGFLATQGAAGGAALAFGGMLGMLGPIALGVTIIADAFRLMSYATELAKQKIAEYNDVAEKANASGFTTDFFQRITKSGGEAKGSVDGLTASLKRFNDASTSKLGGSDIQQRLDQLTTAGNFTSNTGTAAFASAGTAEQKFRAIVDLIDQAMQKGERLAAIDLAGKAFGPQVATALQKNSGYLDQMLKRADAMNAAQLISPDDIGRAIELKERMDAAQKTLEEKWKPIQDDLAKLGMNYHASWVNISEDLAAAVGYATSLYTALDKVPAWFANRIGNASIWKSITDATTTPESRKAAEDSLGISSDPREMGMVTANAALRAQLQNHANVTRGMLQATEVQSAIRGDTSKDPAKVKPAIDDTDAVDRAINTLTRHTGQQEADTRAMDLGVGALARFRAEAAETAAVQANGGKETAEQAAQFATLKDKAESAAVALEKAKVASAIKFSANTALLSPDDVQIASQLRGLYPDVATALNSVEASAMRTNQALSSVSQTASGTLTTGLTDILDGTKSVGAGFSDMSRQIIRALEEALIKMLIVAPIMRGLSGMLGFSGGGIVGDLPLPGAANFIGPIAKADGGMIRGAGTGRSDSIHAMVSNGEFIVNADATARNRGLLETINGGRIPRFADGGLVSNGNTAPGAPMIGGQVIHVSPQISINVEGGSRGPQADAAMAEQLGKHLDSSVRKIIASELRTQSRPGGMLKR